MNFAALESSSHHLSVALSCSGQIRERRANVVNGGSTQMLPWLRELIAEAGIALSSLDAIAFGAGPGAFTGLRLSCGLAQGLALGLGRPVLGVCGLEALAVQAGPGPVVAAIDARMSEIYYACYLVQGDAVLTQLAPACASPQRLAPLPAGMAWTACGDGLLAYPELWRGELAARRDELHPTAAAVARLAAPRLARGEGIDASLAAPLYVRDSVAYTTAERLARGGSR